MVAIRTMPPFLMSSIRFLVAGAILFAISPRRGERLGWRQWVAAAIAGAALLTVGNGGVTWGEPPGGSRGAAPPLAARPPLVAPFAPVGSRTPPPPGGGGRAVLR